jgi:hypothetical protein
MYFALQNTAGKGQSLQCKGRYEENIVILGDLKEPSMSRFVTEICKHTKNPLLDTHI